MVHERKGVPQSPAAISPQDDGFERLVFKGDPRREAEAGTVNGTRNKATKMIVLSLLNRKNSPFKRATMLQITYHQDS